MSAPTVVERVCDVLETIILNGPIDLSTLELQTGLERRQLKGYLAALNEAGFIELDIDDQATVGDRLILILSHRRPSE